MSRLEWVTRLAKEKKAGQIKVFDVRKMTDVTDNFLVCDGTSSTQIKAVADHIAEECKKKQISFRQGGKADSGWIVLDLGDVVVHVMLEEERKFYNLEDLWEKYAIVYHV